MIQAEFGKYRIIAELGHGGMADVYLAVLRGLEGIHKLTVLKCLRHAFAEDAEFVAMLLDEARLATRLNHPNVIHTHEVGQLEGQYYLAMEYLDGQPLNRIQNRAMKRGGPLSSLIQYRILADVLAGLHYAHELADYDGTPLQVVHRDATPHNVFVTYSGQVKIVDFGIAKASRRISETRAGVVKGKVTYMAPEQARGQPVDCRADVFSVGMMLWEAATGQRMWKGMDELAVMHRLLMHELGPTPRQVNPDVPEAIERICLRALARSPDDRYASALEMQKDIESYLRSTGDHIAMADVGKVVSDLFEDRRQELRVIIEKQLANLESEPSSIRMTTSIPVVAMTSSTNLSGVTTPTSTSGTSTTVLAPSGPRMLAAEDASADDRPSVPRRKGPSPAALLAIVAAGGVVAWFASSRLIPSRAQDAAGEAASSAAAEAPALVRLEIRATPPEAKLYLDGAELPANPAKSNFARDALSHTVRAEAPGFVTASRLVSYDQPELLVEIRLEPEPADAAEAAAGSGKTHPTGSRAGRGRGAAAQTTSSPAPEEPPAAATAAPATTPSPSPAGTPPPLDTDNPWSKDKSKLPTLDKENIWRK